LVKLQTRILCMGWPDSQCERNRERVTSQILGILSGMSYRQRKSEVEEKGSRITKTEKLAELLNSEDDQVL
jgi:hypothetical protein